MCAPLFAGYALGIRAAFGWSGAAAVAIGLVELSRRFYPIGPEYTVPEGDVWHRILLLVGVVLVFGVITTRVHAEQLAVAEQRENVIRNLADGLSRKNEETLRARDTALAASRAKGEFLAMMSHEIRTPLNAVLGLAGVLLDGQLATEQREIVRTIRSSGDSLLLLLNDILDFSKIEAGRLQLERAPFDVVECAEDALDLFSAVAVEKGLDLSCRTSPDVPARVFGDSGRVRQILVNLVSNAIKFTFRGSVQVEIDAEPVSVVERDVDTRIHCSVRDTGIGIPEDHLADLFQPFSQVDASTTRRFGGTGLGLAICRTLAERMGGKVWAESQKSRGSTFHFTFLARAMPEISGNDPTHLGDHDGDGPVPARGHAQRGRVAGRRAGRAGERVRERRGAEGGPHLAASGRGARGRVGAAVRGARGARAHAPSAGVRAPLHGGPRQPTLAGRCARGGVRSPGSWPSPCVARCSATRSSTRSASTRRRSRARRACHRSPTSCPCASSSRRTTP